MAAFSRVPTVILSFVFLGVLLLAIACSDNAVPAGRTGIAIVDTVLKAIETGDEEALIPLVRLEDRPCLRNVPSEIQPLCLEDEETSTPVKTFTVAGCIGILHERASAEGVAGRIIDQDLSLYAVYSMPEGNFYSAVYSLLFNRPDPAGTPELLRGVAVLLSEEQIVATEGKCGSPASGFVEDQSLGELILLAD